MFYYAFKTLVTRALIIAASGIARRSTLIGGLVASVPLVCVLALVWLYVDTHDAARACPRPAGRVPLSCRRPHSQRSGAAC